LDQVLHITHIGRRPKAFTCVKRMKRVFNLLINYYLFMRL
jgi:hypothetical protein